MFALNLKVKLKDDLQRKAHCIPSDEIQITGFCSGYISFQISFFRQVETNWLKMLSLFQM